MQDGDDVLFFPSCFGCAKEPTPLRITSIPGSAAPGSSFDVRVVQYAVTFDSEFNATTTEEPAAGASVSAGGRELHGGRRRRGARDGRRSRRRRRARGEGRLRALGDRAGVRGLRDAAARHPGRAGGA